MIYITGDTHGQFDKLYFLENSMDDHETKQENYLIICGDFGGIRTGTEKELSGLQKELCFPFKVLFVSGNHENYDALEKFPVTEWHGGKVQRISENIIHLMRGQVYEIQGKKFFTFGGASSHDIADGILEPNDPNFAEKFRKLYDSHALFRVNHQSWWKQELPTDVEMSEGLQNLHSHNNTVDYVITRCAPTTVQYAFGLDNYEKDILTEYLEQIKNTVSFEHWFYGHYHKDRTIYNKFTCVCDAVIELPE